MLSLKKSNRKLDLVFHFVDPEIEVLLEDGCFDSETAKELKTLIDGLKKSIWIDKTYVGFEDSKYSDVFLTEEGWQALCEMLLATKFGETMHPKNQEQVVEAYSIMIICYLYSELAKRGWSHEHIAMRPKDDEDIEAEIYLDQTPLDSWKDYRGKWQDWPENNY